MAIPELHAPVLLEPILTRATGSRRVVDATLGHGGHTLGFLSLGSAVFGIDRDPDAIATTRSRIPSERLTTLEAPYASTLAFEAVSAFQPDFVLLDLGVSSRQLDDEGRGFTFRPGAPLDMRMSGRGQTAADWLNESEMPELRRVFAEYGDEPRAGKLASEILRRREKAPFRISDDLVNAIRSLLGPRSGPGDFARLFQAVRIAVNEELEGLELALPRFREALQPGGTLAVISYHSGEDRLVKRAFHAWSKGCVCPSGLPQCICGQLPLGVALPRRAVVATQDEIALNPRARSARLRFFQKNQTPAR